MQVVIGQDDADCLVVVTALRFGMDSMVEVRAEDTDIICLLIHHCASANRELYLTTAEGSYKISDIRES